MPKIKQLSQHEAQKIAAGEVVERPANIVKELVENAIDAGAARISVYIEDGGKQLIRIVDNGCGMDTADAQKCFDRHATSKITHVDELENIDTFGFRGEALASIASVSKITLLTKEEHCLEGTQVSLQANNITQVDVIACSAGTDISIADLFFNVPARKKFLKATQTEWRAIQLLFNAFCFDYPHIHFTLFSEGKQVHNCPASTDIQTRALQLFEPVAHKHILAITHTDKEISISGVISDHQHYRYDRSHIYFFVNKRWVKNQHVGSALIKGYTNVLPQGRYPIAAINITVPSHEVDINIHPRKEEVKFLHPRRVEQALQQAVKAALEQNLSKHLKKDVVFKDAESWTQNIRSRDFNPFAFEPFLRTPVQESVSQSSIISAHPDVSEEALAKSELADPFVLPAQRSLGEAGSLSKETNEINTSTSFLPFAHFDTLNANGAIDTPDIKKNSDLAPTNYRLIGQYNNTYLLVEKEDGLFLVDQHAAHERILYELFSQRFAEVASMQLLFPHIITLSTQDIHTITPHLDIFAQHGIMIEQCASDQLIIQSLPVHLKNESIADLVKEAISWIIESQSLDTDAFKKTINHKLQAQMACKAAVKAGDILTQEKMEQLLRDLEKTNNRFSCPHGRPTGWLLSLADIEKKFRRRL
jgi:DNA mismatch repair protein MutL